MLVEGLFRLVVVALLSSTLAVQLLILKKMPEPLPSLAILGEASTVEEKRALLLRRPLVTVDGTVGVTGTVDVSVEGTVDVSVENTPLEVEVTR